MNIKEGLRQPLLFAILTALTLGLFSVVYMVYMVIRLQTYKYFLSRPVAGICGVFLLFFPIFEYTGHLTISRTLLTLIFATLFVVQWVGIPNKLEEKREFAGIFGQISWKHGLIPIIALFYNFGYLFIHVRHHAVSFTSFTVTVLLLFISFILALSYWVWIVAARFKDYLDNREEVAQVWREERQTRIRQRNLVEMIKPDKPDDLPMLELSDFEVNKENNSNEEEFTLEFDDDSDFK